MTLDAASLGLAQRRADIWNEVSSTETFRRSENAYHVEDLETRMGLAHAGISLHLLRILDVPIHGLDAERTSKIRARGRERTAHLGGGHCEGLVLAPQ